MAPLDDNTTYQLNSLADDRLDGAGAIAAFYFGADTPVFRKKVYYLKLKGAPIGKRGDRRLVASRRVLTAWDDTLTNGHLKQGPSNG